MCPRSVAAASRITHDDSPAPARPHQSLLCGRPSGFALVEVLVSVFVFAIGMLGIGALQLISKQAGAEASQRTIAASLAFELLERMRLNNHSHITAPSPLATYVANGASLSAQMDGVTNCTTTNCNPYQLADFDLHRVFGAALGATETRNGQNVGGLVDPTLCVTGPGDGESGAYQVTITWRGKTAMRDGHPDNACGSGSYGANNEFRRILVLQTYLPHVDDE